jgi:leader peptidase (prepilin peptidase)/N-methyltransferase
MTIIQYLFYFILLGLLVAVSVIDIKKSIIPNKLVLSIAALSFFRIAIGAFPFWDGLFGLLAGGVPFALIIFFTNGAMGAGDMKLYAVLGLFFGVRGILCISVLSILFAGLAALILLILKKKDRKSNLVMAPFITAAAVAAMLFEPQINLFLKTFYHI